MSLKSLGIRVCAGLAALCMALPLAGCSQSDQPAGDQPAQSQTQHTSKEPAAKAAKTFAQVFPDTHLAQCMASVMDGKPSQAFDKAKAAALDSLSFPSYEQNDSCATASLNAIADLTGLESFTALRYLDISPMVAVDSLAPVSSLSSLTQINLYGTKVSDLTPLSGLKDLSQIALPASACSLDPLRPLPLVSVSVECPTADIAVLDGKKAQLYLPAGSNAHAAEQSAQSGNTVTIRNDDGSFDMYKLGDDGQVAVTHI